MPNVPAAAAAAAAAAAPAAPAENMLGGRSEAILSSLVALIVAILPIVFSSGCLRKLSNGYFFLGSFFLSWRSLVPSVSVAALGGVAAYLAKQCCK